jgi:hypothetical protein
MRTKADVFLKRALSVVMALAISSSLYLYVFKDVAAAERGYDGAYGGEVILSMAIFYALYKLINWITR